MASYDNKNWKYHIKSKYGVTEEAYNALFQAQNGRCKICRLNSPKKLSIDHDHTTGRIRGLLCQSCNVGVGMFKDDVDLLAKAIEYLK